MQFIAHFFRPLHPECYKLARVSPSGRRLQIFIPFAAFISKVFLSSTYSFNLFFSYSRTHPAPCRYPFIFLRVLIRTVNKILRTEYKQGYLHGCRSISENPRGSVCLRYIRDFWGEEDGSAGEGFASLVSAVRVWKYWHRGILCTARCSLQVECHGGFLISALMEASPSLGMCGCTVVTVFLERLWDVNPKIIDFTQSHRACWLPEHANILSVIYSDYFNCPDWNHESSAHHYLAIVRTSEQAGSKSGHLCEEPDQKTFFKVSVCSRSRYSKRF